MHFKFFLILIILSYLTRSNLSPYYSPLIYIASYIHSLFFFPSFSLLSSSALSFTISDSEYLNPHWLLTVNVSAHSSRTSTNCAPPKCKNSNTLFPARLNLSTNMRTETTPPFLHGRFSLYSSSHLPFTVPTTFLCTSFTPSVSCRLLSCQRAFLHILSVTSDLRPRHPHPQRAKGGFAKPSDADVKEAPHGP